MRTVLVMGVKYGGLLGSVRKARSDVCGEPVPEEWGVFPHSSMEKQSSWFVLISDNHDLETLKAMLSKQLPITQRKERILKVRVQELEIEDT